MTTLVRAIAALGLVFVAWLLGGSRSREEVVRAPILRQVVKHPWLTAGGLAAGAIIIGVLLLVSGVVPIKASSGHWALTAAILDFAKTRSVSTHSWGITAPPLEDEALVLRGAGHYESACLPCHGGPHRTIPPVMSAMTPTLLEKEGKLLMVVGTPGGSTIITSVFQTILNVIAHDMSMTEAVTAKRLHHQWKPDMIQMESDAVPEEVRNALEAMGHQLRQRGNIGRVDAILVRPDGTYEGAADPRGDDWAGGF